jgi:hypothetical protein
MGQTAASGCERLSGFSLKQIVLVLPNHQHTLKMGTELFPEMSENLDVLRGCLTEKISLNSVAAKSSKLTLRRGMMKVTPNRKLIVAIRL